MKLLKFSITIFLICICIAGQAQDLRAVSGTVAKSNNEPIQGALVRLVGGQFIQDATDQQGNFLIQRIPQGRYQLEVSATGYQTYTTKIVIDKEDIHIGRVILVAVNKAIDEVNVYGRYYQNYKMDSISGSLRLQSSLLETPQNIQVLSHDLLSDQMAVDMRDGILRNVSGVTMVEHWSSLFARVNMRGSRVAAFRNGMNVTGSWGPLTEDMSFVERIEFVKGPAGFMMSNGEPSGIYNVVTKKPTGSGKGEATFMLGSFDFYRSTVDLDGKLNKSGKLLYRLNVMGQSNKSHRDLEFADRYTIAPVLSYQLDDKTKLTLEYTLQHATMSNVGSAYVFAKDGYGGLPRDFSLLERGVEPTNINDQSAFFNVEHTFNPDWKLTGQLAYFHYDQEGSSLWLNPLSTGDYIADNGDLKRYVGIWDALGQNRYAQVYLNGKIKTNTVTHRILGGIDLGSKEYYADWSTAVTLDTGSRNFNIYNPVYGVAQLPDFDRSADIRLRGKGGYSYQSYTGLYIQDELGFWADRIRLTLAGRFTHVVETSGTNIAVKRDKQRFTPRIGISGNLDHRTAVYALYDQTFIPQSGLLRSGEQPLPVTGNNYEVGLKRDWFNGKLNTTLAAYRILKNNTTAADPANAAGETFVINVGQTIVKGIEFDVKGQLAKGLDMIANYAWTDGEISKASSAAAATVGNKISGYATHNANIWTTYTVQSGTLTGFGVKAGANYQADRTTWTWTGATGLASLPDYFRLDGGLFWQREKMKINLNVNNLLDEYLYSGSAYASYYYWQTEPGRNFRLGVSYKF